jgi:hypothetical protein
LWAIEGPASSFKLGLRRPVNGRSDRVGARRRQRLQQLFVLDNFGYLMIAVYRVPRDPEQLLQLSRWPAVPRPPKPRGYKPSIEMLDLFGFVLPKSSPPDTLLKGAR